MRLFAGVWPSAAVVASLGTLARPDLPGIRWVAPSQWHVTLAFYGEVPASEVPALARDLAAAGGAVAGPVTAELGPRTMVLGSTLGLPVYGLQALGEAVRAATAGFGRGLDPRPFRAHLTLARSRGRRAVPSRLEGRIAWTDASGPTGWVVEEVVVASSVRGEEGVRYEAAARVALPTGGGGPPGGVLPDECPRHPRTNMRSPLQ